MLYIIFEKCKDNMPFWNWICGKKFGHVYAIINDGYNWILINPTIFSLKIEIMNFDICEDVIGDIALDKDTEIFEIMMQDINNTKCYIPQLCLVSCVGVIKYLLGLRTFAITPHQLYKKLLKLSLDENYEIINWRDEYGV